MYRYNQTCTNCTESRLSEIPGIYKAFCSFAAFWDLDLSFGRCKISLPWSQDNNIKTWLIKHGNCKPQTSRKIGWVCVDINLERVLSCTECVLCWISTFGNGSCPEDWTSCKSWSELRRRRWCVASCTQPIVGTVNIYAATHMQEC